MKTSLLAAVTLTLLGSTTQAAPPKKAVAPPAPAPASADPHWPEAYFEIFKLAPGKQEQFIRLIARGDEVSAAGGQPPIQMFIHEDGADWDILLYKPVTDAKPTAAQEAAMDAKSKELGIPTGPAYFVEIRELLASHTDTRTYGPLTAGDWLARLDAWRAEHPSATGGK